jgi:hypothetical protein
VCYESEEVVRWSLMEQWQLGVAWPERDGGALGASSDGKRHRGGSFLFL